MRAGITLSASHLLVMSVLFFNLLSPDGTARDDADLPGGELRILGAEDHPATACPLKHTDVNATICGFMARVDVKQVFHNPLGRKIEAVYVFPLPHGAAVDDMTMFVGDRCIRSRIEKRDEARRTYERARAAGHVAGLLDQERPNIFTQSVANIEPGAAVEIRISYVETLKYEEGVFEFVFPMVVEPRYMPGHPVGRKGTGWSPDTCQVPDASKISPPVARPGTRAGHDIDLKVTIDAGMSLSDLESVLHDIQITHHGSRRITASLARRSVIPNRDFILRYSLAKEEIGDAFFIHEDHRGKFFTLILQPPRQYIPMQLVPRELIFVLDTSGSMKGFPIEKAKETMSRALDSMRPGDTFNIILFSGQTRILWDDPRPNTLENRAEAQGFLACQQGRGGTEMMEAVNAALRKRAKKCTVCSSCLEREAVVGKSLVKPIRIVCFMTDGCVGNDLAIIDAVKKNADTTRVFSFGIGNSTNRFLLDGMAHAGRGEVEYVTLVSQAGGAVKRFYERILAPLLTDIEIDWGGLPVFDVYPRRIPDLFSSKPVLIHGRLKEHADAAITLRGTTGSGPFARRIRINTRGDSTQNDALASLWARKKVESLVQRDLIGQQKGRFSRELKETVTALGLEFRLMTRFTSFVAVDESTFTEDGKPVTIPVTVELPDGVSHEGIFGSSAMSGGCGFLMGRGPSGPRGASTGGMGRKKWSSGAGFERWEFWWENNKDSFLAARRQRIGIGYRDEARRAAEGPVLEGEKAVATERLAPDVTQRDIMPSLRKALRVDDPDILDSAVLAIARMTRPEDASLVLEEIKSLLGSKHRSVRQSACLSLGVLRSPAAFSICCDLMADSPAGRRLTGQAKVSRLVRAFAALSLGLIGEKKAAPLLRLVIEKEDQKKQRDLIACAILSLGMINRDDSEGESTRFLIELLHDSRFDPMLRAYAPIALHRLGNKAAVGSLAALLKNEKVNCWIRQSCAVALGQLAAIEDSDVIDLLMGIAANGKDVQTRLFSFIALGQIGARDDDYARHQEMQKRIARFLLARIVTPDRPQHRAWAALAGSIQAMKHDSLKGPITKALREQFLKVKDPSEKGAVAISLGLLDDAAAAGDLYGELKTTRDATLQGYLCVSLALMNWTGATETIRHIASGTILFRLRLQAATALGVMGDRNAVGTLLKMLENAQTLSVAASAAKALGLIGDPRAVPLLQRVLTDPKANALTRAFAAVSIGMIGEKTDLPWNTVFSEDFNYRAKVDAIAEVLDIL